MRHDAIHSWDLKPAEAIELQKELRQRVELRPLDKEPRLVAGCDISFNKYSDVIYAGILVIRLPQLDVIDRATVVTTTKFPYVPGLLSFREAPALLQAWEKLTTQPDAVMLDGHGLAHPRRFGIACHFGLLTGTPSFGCGKTVLVGAYDEPGELAGSYSELVHRGEVVGAAVRTKDGVSPVFVSPGNLIDLPGAIKLTLKCVKGYEPAPEAGLFPGMESNVQSKSKYRIPEPTRLAHLMVNALRRGEPLE